MLAPRMHARRVIPAAFIDGVTPLGKQVFWTDRIVRYAGSASDRFTVSFERSCHNLLQHTQREQVKRIWQRWLLPTGTLGDATKCRLSRDAKTSTRELPRQAHYRQITMPDGR